MGYYIKKTLIKGAPRIVRKSRVVDGQPVIDDSSVVAKIVGYVIGMEGSDKTLILDRDSTAAFILQKGEGDRILNAKVAMKPGKRETIYYVTADGVKLQSLKESRMLERIDNEDGTIKPEYAQFEKLVRKNVSGRRAGEDQTARIEKAKKDLAARGLPTTFDF